MKVSIIIPSYNELKTLPEILEKIFALNLEKEVIVVDDGSDDGTSGWLEGMKNKEIPAAELKIFRHQKNMGKGAAIITGIKNATGEIIMIQDADLEYDPRQIPGFVDLLTGSDYQAVYGSRLLAGKNRIYNLFYLWGNRFLTFLINFLFGAGMTDSYTCYKFFKAGVLRDMNLVSDGFEIEAEISAKTALKKLKFAEIPVEYIPRNRQEGKKIKFKDAVKGIFKIFEIWFKGS
ncbi:MAG: glycosyltransferase family 2 protein [Elusimicrobia bacterium]|nr:glycosyltransferase family 2 protein [Elusimicrobiota bacterium]